MRWAEATRPSPEKRVTEEVGGEPEQGNKAQPPGQILTQAEMDLCVKSVKV